MAGGATLDAGALIAFERSNRRMVARIARAFEQRAVLAIPAAVLAQVWRDGSKQARLAWLLGSDLVRVIPMDDRAARIIGQICGVTKVSDVVDVSVIECARRHEHAVWTTDVEDLRRIAPDLELVPV